MSNQAIRSSINSAVSPRRWNDFFDNNFTVDVENRGKFDCYSKGTEGPYWLIYLHCGAHNALSFAVLCKEMSALANCKQLCISLRGHGKTITDDDNNYTLDTMTTDIRHVLERLFSSLPDMILIGHGVGGVIAVNLSLCLKCIVGLVALDSVESENANNSLPRVRKMIETMPSSFMQLEDAIIWALRNDFIGNIYSASVSIPGILWNLSTRQFASDEVYEKVRTSSNISMIDKHLLDIMIKDKSEIQVCNSDFQDGYACRQDLSRLEPFCAPWYKSLTKKFLAISIPKLMILSKGEVLSDELIKGQMLGSFQCDILPSKGKIVHEDKSEVVAGIIVDFLKTKIQNFETFH